MWGGSMYAAITWAGINMYGVCYGDVTGEQSAALACGDDFAAVVCGDTSVLGVTAGGTRGARGRGTSSGAGRVAGGTSKREGC